MASLFTEKHGRLEGGALTDEALDSSPSVLQRTHTSGNGVRGLQQWFTPQPIALFVARVIGRYNPALDFTAGQGSMLSGFAPDYRYGVEIDADHINSKVPYDAIHGDAQRAVPMLRAAGVKLPAVVLNPPYGLDWRDPVHAKGKINSTLLSYLWALDLVSLLGQGAVLCGTERIERDILAHPRGAGRAVYAIVDLEGEVWKGVTLPTSIAFFVSPSNIEDAWTPERRIRLSAPPQLDDLLPLQREITRALYTAAKYPPPSSVTGSTLDHVADGWKAVKAEYARRKALHQGAGGARVHRNDLSIRNRKISVHPNAYARIALNNAGILRDVQLLNNQSVTYFASNPKAWKLAASAEEKGLISIEPSLKEKVAKVMEETDLITTPLFPVKPHMRLGWLTDLEKITAIKTDPARGITAGQTYELETRSKAAVEKTEKAVDNRRGEPEIRKVEIERKVLSVRITADNMGVIELSETKADAEYLLSHFRVPDPGDVATRYPQRHQRMLQLLDAIEVECRFHYDRYMARLGIKEYPPFRIKPFQKDHLARLLTKSRGLLAHEQGLGKTYMLMILAEAARRLGAEDKALFVAPQDLMPQWAREAQKFFGRKLELIQSPDDAVRVARRLKRSSGETGWFITYYECLSLTGRKYEELPPVYLSHKERLKNKLAAFKQWKREAKQNGLSYKAYRSEVGKTFTPVVGKEKKPKSARQKHREMGYYERIYTGDTVKDDEPATSRWACPKCRVDTAADKGWDGVVCHNPECGYVHKRVHKKPAYAYLGKAFIDAPVCVDEVAEIRGDDSLRSKSLRALARGRWNFGGTGTPISNYVNDCFWALWWCLGDATPAFPYSYEGGKAKFEEDFCVIEHLMGKEEDGEEHRRVRKKILPQVTNVSQFWRLTQPAVSRCRKEQTGEPLVPRTFHPIFVPMGEAQQRFEDFCLDRFTDWFCETYPEHDAVKQGIVERFAAALGQLWWLEFAATMPKSHPHTQEWDEAKAEAWYDDLSNYTPATLKVMELAIEHAESGEKVLIGSDLMATGRWISERLGEKGVHSVHLTEEKNGVTATKNPRKRAKEVTEFTTGSASVMCAGIKSMKLGHNLDVASVVIVHGLPYSFMEMDQFIARVHRLTSKKPVKVYVVIPQGSLAQKKWQLLKDKGSASDLAFDGKLAEENEEAIDYAAMLKEMKRRGLRSADDQTISEADVLEEWKRLRYRPTTPVRRRPTAHTNSIESKALPYKKIELRALELAGEASNEVVPPKQPQETARIDITHSGLVVQSDHPEAHKAVAEARENAKRKEKSRKKKAKAPATDTLFGMDDTGEIVYVQASLF